MKIKMTMTLWNWQGTFFKGRIYRAERVVKPGWGAGYIKVTKRSKQSMYTNVGYEVVK